jgi:hypothetical protein
MARCAGFKPSGEPCERIVRASQDYCYSHDPDRADERQRNAARAGRSKPNKEIQDIKQRLSDLANDVLGGSVDKGAAAVASQTLNVYLRALGMELKIKEVTELEERLEALEQNQEREGDKRRWG